jgi:hypothetical protein
LIETPFQGARLVNIDQGNSSLAAGGSRRPGPPGRSALTRDLVMQFYPNLHPAANHEKQCG